MAFRANIAVADPALTKEVARYEKTLKAPGVSDITMLKHFTPSLASIFNSLNFRGKAGKLTWLPDFMRHTRGTVAADLLSRPHSAFIFDLVRRVSEDELRDAKELGIVLLEPVGGTPLQTIAERCQQGEDSSPTPLLGRGQNILKATFVLPAMVSVNETCSSPVMESPSVQEVIHRAYAAPLEPPAFTPSFWLGADDPIFKDVPDSSRELRALVFVRPPNEALAQLDNFLLGMERRKLEELGLSSAQVEKTVAKPEAKVEAGPSQVTQPLEVLDKKSAKKRRQREKKYADKAAAKQAEEAVKALSAQNSADAPDAPGTSGSPIPADDSTGHAVAGLPGPHATADDSTGARAPESRPSTASTEHSPETPAPEVHPSTPSTETSPGTPAPEAPPSTASTKGSPAAPVPESQPSTASTETSPVTPAHEAPPSTASTETSPETPAPEAPPSTASTETSPAAPVPGALPSTASTETSPVAPAPEVPPSTASTERSPGPAAPGGRATGSAVSAAAQGEQDRNPSPSRAPPGVEGKESFDEAVKRAMATEMASVFEKFAEMEKNQKSHEGLAAHLQTIGRLEGEVKQLKEDVAEVKQLKEDVAGLEKTITGQQEEIDSLRKQITELQGIVPLLHRTAPGC